MKITPVTHGLDLGISHGVRSPGIHMSELYNALYQELEPQRFKKGSKPDELRLEAGLMFEELLEDRLIARFGRDLGGERPGEFVTSDGVYYTPDLIIYDKDGPIVGEIKLTWLSSRFAPRKVGEFFPSQFQKYLTQIQAYCYHLDIARARLFVFFVNGSYRPPSPELLCWNLEFTPRELSENWQMLVNHGRHAGLLPCGK